MLHLDYEAAPQNSYKNGSFDGAPLESVAASQYFDFTVV